MTPVRRGQWQTASDVLMRVSRQPGITRAAVARELRLSTSSATEVTARLRDVRLLTEAPAPSQGRGRPTTVLRAHPKGPVALGLDLRQGSWRSAVVALDGSFVEQQSRRHRSRRSQVVLSNLQKEVERAHRQYGARLRVVSLAAPGTIRDNRLMQAPTLDWAELDLETVTARTGIPLLAGNDATLSGVAEARTGAAAGAGTALHLIVEVGLGGTLIIDGVPAQGASGAGGEYGHVPFGDRTRFCPCGARGCWDLDIDGRALARHLKEAAPDDPYAYAEAVLRRTDRAAARAVAKVVTALGTGIAGLVNAHDPDVVTLGGLAIPLRAAAETSFEQAYLAGLMTFHRSTPPPVLSATHQPDGPLRGAAALALDHLTSEPSIATWAASQ
ncbi:ROK family transcriptional regulator [Kribbella capetownensis]|uniref:ROK family transcriptional regulator n=1 Tax=Kribbella capetownensis TaxID=1572659 RepID=A0A4R0JCW4_9ACTN|nr:ROK family transcriptional regulator [Kribbella capetownensis]TCC44551.1 ROK family transcriptional regulator [Kribbella capetownensis]